MSDVEIIKSRFVLEAGTDPAKVEALRIQLVTTAKVQRNLAIGLVVAGVVLSLTLIGALIGVPFIVVGSFMALRVRKTLKSINIAAEEYLAKIA